MGDQLPEGYEHEPVEVLAAVESRDFRTLAARVLLWPVRYGASAIVSGVGATVQGSFCGRERQMNGATYVPRRKRFSQARNFCFLEKLQRVRAQDVAGDENERRSAT